MVQRKLTNKVSDHVKSDKRLANMKKLSSSQHQDGKNNRGADMKKKIKKSKSIKLSDLEALQTPSSPSRKSTSSQRTTNASPNYMKATSSSHAKKELFQVSHNDFKNPQRKCSSDSKARCVSSKKKPSKALTRSSSFSLVRALTKTTSFKASRAPQRATCSSTLKDSKFPSYLMLSPGGTESQGTSLMKVCPYTYCSLNGHRHAVLPPLKSFVAARRRLLKTQKSMRVEALSPRRSTKKDSDSEQNVFDDEIGMMDIFIEVYTKEKEEKPIDFVKEIEDQEDIKAIIEEIKPEIDLDEDFKKYFDAYENNQPIRSHEEISLGSYFSEDIEMDDLDYKANDMEFEEEQFRGFDQEEDVDSSSLSEEEKDSKVESLSESSHDMSVTWLDDCYENILSEETFKEDTEEEPDGIETQDTNDLSFNQSSLKDESCEYLIDAEENGGEIEKQEDDEASCNMKVIEVPEDSTIAIQGKANEFKNTSCIDSGEEENESMNWKGGIRCKRGNDDDDDMRMFNPREPNFLPLVPEPDPEKVDLRHQMIDERKNAEEWMIDCALRQVVTKLAPARKKKVALLVEAFETVMPIPKYETHMRNNSDFAHGRRIQACS